MMEAGKSKLSRRTMMAGMTVGVASLGAAAFAALDRVRGPMLTADSDSWWNRGRVPLEQAAMREWSARVGKAFEVEGGGSYKLARVQALPSTGDRPPEVARRSAFLLVFEASGEGSAVDGNRTYNVSHSGGALDIFFAAADPEAPNRLSAVFN